jgi:hypothetical protein
MDTVGDDAWKSVRLAWEAERWLPIGMLVAALAFALWIGLTGATVTFLAELAIGAVTVDPWTAATDAVAGVLFLCWVVAPAAIATWLVRDRLTTVRGTLEIGYRLHHPILLLVPPLVVLAAGALALIGLGSAGEPVLAALVAGSIWFQVRTIAYSYRVFAFAVPVLTYAMTLLTAALLAVAALVAGARLVGRGVLVEAVATTLAARTDSPAVVTLVDGTVDIAGVDVPALHATLVAVPVALGVAYVSVQLAASLVARLVKPTTRRPELRSGQRYPEFARPTTTVAPSPAPGSEQASSAASTAGEGSPKSDRSTEDDASVEAGPDDGAADDAEPVPDLSNTRVFTGGDDAPPVSPTAVAPDAECPVCGATFDPEAASETCPDCGADL